jgi:hypothetical protein
VLLLSPAVAPVVWSLRRAPRNRTWSAAAVGALMLAPTAVAALWYDEAATGSATKSPFNLLQPADRLGFGTRKLYPEDTAHHFGPLQGLEGLVVHFGDAAVLWSPAAALLLIAWLVHRTRGQRNPWSWPRRLLCAAAVLYLAGYFPFWGPWNASLLWGGPTRLGPMYALPTLAVVALLTAPVVVRVFDRATSSGLRRWALAIAVVAVATDGAQAAVAGYELAGRAVVSHQIVAAADRIPPRSLVLLDVDHPYLGHPVSLLVNDPGKPPRYALESELPWAALPPASTPLFALQIPGDPYGARASWLVTRLRPVAAGTVLSARPSNAADGVLVLERAGTTEACLLRAGTEARLRVTASGLEVMCDRTAVPARWLEGDNYYHRCTSDGCLALGWFPDVGSGGLRLADWRRVATSTDAQLPRLLTDTAVVDEHGRGGLLLTAAGRAG